MTESFPSNQRGITAATGTQTRPDRPDVSPPPATAEGRAGAESAVEPAVAEAPVLITEQEVLFSTAAAVTHPTKRAAKHRHCPHHYFFLEQALMAREMERC